MKNLTIISNERSMCWLQILTNTSKFLTFIFFILALSSNVLAQRTCATAESYDEENTNPVIFEKRQVIEEQIQQRIFEIENMKGENAMRELNGNVYTIPTVFHVIHTGTSSTTNNIPDSYLLAQLEQMNDDFRRQNSDANSTWSQAADTEIEFCLASIDPSGNPTTGITRNLYTTGTWTRTDINSTIKPATIWDRDDYLNIWVIPNPTKDNGDGLLGYAQFPGGAANTDGVVCKTSSIGSIALPNPSGGNFDQGRTSTHEIGHWLNLRHVWGDGDCSVDDLVSDTPVSDAPNYGCALTHISCTTLDMVQNYMDYSNDACMNLFTSGQRTRMRAAITTSRSGLITSSCGAIVPELDCTNAIPISCGDTLSGDNTLGTNAITSYNCYSGNESGNEVIYEFELDYNADVTITNTGSLIDHFLLSACDETTCLDWGISSTTTSLTAGTYYIVVDGYNGQAGTFDISVNCTSTVDCSTGVTIQCGETISSDNTIGTNQINAYSCIFYNESGNEVFYNFNLANASNVTITDDNSNIDHFIIDACDPSTCINFGLGNSTTYLEAGSYVIVADGYNGFAGSFDITVNCIDSTDCSIPSYFVNCGDTVFGDNSTGYNQIGEYGCYGGDESGNEIFYQITIDNISELTVTDDNFDIDHFILADCNPQNCINFGLNSSTTILLPGNYYVVADGYFGAIDTFNMSFNCTNALDCANAIQMECGDTYSGDTNLGSNYLTSYNCGSNQTGNEIIHTITTTEVSTITATLAGDPYFDDFIDVFILAAYDPSTCIDVGFLSATFENAPAGTYYIVVDGYAETNGAYDLTVDCSTDSCPEDLLYTNETFVPGTYQASNTLVATGNVPTNAAGVTFVAGNGIELNDNFIANNNFQAIIESCEVPSAKLAQKNTTIKTKVDLNNLRRLK